LWLSAFSVKTVVLLIQDQRGNKKVTIVLAQQAPAAIQVDQELMLLVW